MRIFVKAKPGAHTELVQKVDDTHFVVSVREPPEKGLANLAVRKALADFLGVAAQRVTQLSGFSSRHKVFPLD